MERIDRSVVLHENWAIFGLIAVISHHTRVPEIVHRQKLKCIFTHVTQEIIDKK